MASNTEILKFYDLDNLYKHCSSLMNHGRIDKLTGEFIFDDCEKCKGPMLAHHKCLAEDKPFH